MKTLSTALALTALLATTAAPALALAQAAPADRAFEATTLNLSAGGEVKATPDQAVITLGVQTKAATAAEAMAGDAAQMNQVMAALRRAGLTDRDIQTSNISLNAQYDYQQNQPPRLTGYMASNDVTITVNDLKRVGATLDAVVSAGANQINGISFGLKDPAAAEDAARRAAVVALRAKADLYAQATGYKVTRLINLSEGGGYVASPPRVFAMAKAMPGGAPTPVSAGELTVRIDVTGIYELGR
jgi:uncharacterized protein YggE